MKISHINNYSTNFTRALTKNEEESYKKLLDDTFSALNIKDSSAIIFDFSVPSEKNFNTGIGTSFSDYSKNFFEFLKNYINISSIQYGPQGKITSGNTSPYSGTNFAIGEHLIDLKKLSLDSYGSILDESLIKTIDEKYPNDKIAREYKVNYEYILDDKNNDGIQQKALKIAFKNYNEKLKKNIPEVLNLNSEFEKFKIENNSWLEKEILFEVLSQKYQTSDFNKWNDTDKNLFQLDDSSKNKRICELKEKFKNEVEFQKFVQFIALKQQNETKEFLNQNDIQLYGDCLIGFSNSEIWANQDCFRENLFYGGPDPNCTETNGIQAWGLRALDYTKLGKCDKVGDLSEIDKVGEFLYKKYVNFFSRYDSLRMDAAWQFVTPFIYQTIDDKFQEVKMPEIGNTIFNILKTAAIDVYGDIENINERVMLELVGTSADASRKLTLNQYPHLYTTAYAQYNETPKKFLDKGYKQGAFCVGVGNHDNESLIEMANKEDIRILHSKGIKKDYDFNFENLSFQDKNYQKQSRDEKLKEDFKNAKLAEIYTSSKQFFTLNDMFGMQERINISGKADKNNWTLRIPTNFEEFYFSQLQKGYGMNMGKILANALRMKKVDNPVLIKKCEEVAEVLRSEGATTQAQAQKDFKQGKIKNPFKY